MIEKVRLLIRPFISVVFVITTACLALTGMVDPNEILTITGLIIAFHFGERSALKDKDKKEK